MSGSSPARQVSVRTGDEHRDGQGEQRRHRAAFRSAVDASSGTGTEVAVPVDGSALVMMGAFEVRVEPGVEGSSGAGTVGGPRDAGAGEIGQRGVELLQVPADPGEFERVRRRERGGAPLVVLAATAGWSRPGSAGGSPNSPKAPAGGRPRRAAHRGTDQVLAAVHAVARGQVVPERPEVRVEVAGRADRSDPRARGGEPASHRAHHDLVQPAAGRDALGDLRWLAERVGGGGLHRRRRARPDLAVATETRRPCSARPMPLFGSRATPVRQPPTARFLVSPVVTTVRSRACRAGGLGEHRGVVDEVVVDLVGER